MAATDGDEREGAGRAKAGAGYMVLLVFLLVAFAAYLVFTIPTALGILEHMS